MIWCTNLVRLHPSRPHTCRQHAAFFKGVFLICGNFDVRIIPLILPKMLVKFFVKTVEWSELWIFDKRKKPFKKMHRTGRRTQSVQDFLQNSDGAVFKMLPVGRSELRILHKWKKKLQKKVLYWQTVGGQHGQPRVSDHANVHRP